MTNCVYKEAFDENINKKFDNPGVKLLAAHNGNESIENIMEEKPELVILNAIMTEAIRTFGGLRPLTCHSDPPSA